MALPPGRYVVQEKYFGRRNLHDAKHSADVTGEQLASAIQQYVAKYASYDGNGTVTFDIKTWRSDLENALASYKSWLADNENVTADTILNQVDADLTSRYGLVLSDIFSTATINAIKTNLNSVIELKVDLVSALLKDFDEEGPVQFFVEAVVEPLYRLGSQVAAANIKDFIAGNNSDSIKEFVGEFFNKVFANEKVVETVTDALAQYGDYLNNSLFAETDSLDHMDYIFNGTNQTAKFGYYESTGGKYH